MLCESLDVASSGITATEPLCCNGASNAGVLLQNELSDSDLRVNIEYPYRGVYSFNLGFESELSI